MIAKELLTEEIEFAYTDGELIRLAQMMDIPLATTDELREMFG